MISPSTVARVPAGMILDKPIQTAQPILVSEVLEAVEQYEPRAQIGDVTTVKGSRNFRNNPLVCSVCFRPYNKRVNLSPAHCLKQFCNL